MVDVARSAGVSLKTVSRVVNGEPGVSGATAEKVLAAAAELRYERNDLAASLRQGDRSHTVGLVIEDVGNPFYSLIAQAVEETARERQSLLITASAREDPDRERELVIALLRRRVDALLIVPTGPDHRYLQEAGFGARAVFLDRPPARMQADTVLIDNAVGARQAVEHLLGHGHERVAFVGDNRRLYTARERLKGYRRALDAGGVEPDESSWSWTAAPGRRPPPPRSGCSRWGPAGGQRPSSGVTTAAPSASCKRCGPSAAHRRSSALTTSSSPTCSRSQWCALTRTVWARSAPSWPSPG